MDPARFDSLLRVATVVFLVAGLALIFASLGSQMLTTVGVVLVILSALVFLVVVRNFLAEYEGSTAGE